LIPGGKDHGAKRSGPRALETKFLLFWTRQEQDSVLLRPPPGGQCPVFRVLAWTAKPPPSEAAQTIMSIAGHVSRAMLSVTPPADGSETARLGRDRCTPEGGRPEAQGGSRAARASCYCAWVSGSSVITRPQGRWEPAQLTTRPSSSYWRTSAPDSTKPAFPGHLGRPGMSPQACQVRLCSRSPAWHWQGSHRRHRTAIPH
jgi:hypothetical protein